MRSPLSCFRTVLFTPHSKTTDTTFLFKDHLKAVIDLCFNELFTVIQVRVFTGTINAFSRIYALHGSGSTGLCRSSSAACLVRPILTLSTAAAAATIATATATTATATTATAATDLVWF